VGRGCVQQDLSALPSREKSLPRALSAGRIKSLALDDTLQNVTAMDDLLLKYLVRSYYFAEAMTFYELYYDPLVSTYEQARTRLQDPGRQEDRPPTWVPMVFHCTTLELAPQIFESGYLSSFTKGVAKAASILRC
jgi:hypothetical protein